MEGEDEELYGDGEATHDKVLKMARGTEAQQQAIEMTEREFERMLVPHTGTDAHLALQEYDQRYGAAMKDARKAYGEDSDGFRHFAVLADTAMRGKRDALAKAVGAEVRHGFGVMMKQATEDAAMQMAQRDISDMAAETARQSLDAGDAAETMNSGLAEVDGQTEEMKHQAERARQEELDRATSDEEKQKIREKWDTIIGGISVGATQAKSAVASKGLEVMGGVKTQAETAARGHAKPFIDGMRRVFKTRFDGHRRLGQSAEIAYTNALEATRNASLLYFKERLARGQFSAVMFMLDQLEKDADAAFDASKQNPDTPMGAYDPTTLGCMHRSDIKAIRDAAVAQLREDAQARKAANAQMTEGLKLANAGIKAQADIMARSMFIDKKEMDKLYQQAQELLAKGLPQASETIAYLRGIEEHVQTRYEKAVKDAEKAKTAETFRTEYEDYLDGLRTAAPMFFYGVGDRAGRLDYTRDEKGAPINVDGRVRLMAFIQNGINRGVIQPSDGWSDILKELEENKAATDYMTAMGALERCGLRFDAKKTQSVIEAGGGKMEDYGEEVGFPTQAKWVGGKPSIGNEAVTVFYWDDPAKKNRDRIYLTGAQMNSLLSEVSNWQRRHVNPTEGELASFIGNVLERSARRGTIVHWFTSNEEDAVKAFGDISYEARKATEQYFRGSGFRSRETLDAYTLGRPLPDINTPGISAVRAALKKAREKAAKGKNDGGKK